jgi:F420-dependent oxidoreductase-like protein
MRIGLYLVLSGDETLGTVLDRTAEAARAGLHSVYFSQTASWDSLTAVALAGQRAPGVRLGTAIVPSYPRHPVALAAQALTANAATGGRLTLGIGPSHREAIEGGYGYSYDRPARHIREYLTALLPLLRGEAVDHRGETLRAAVRLSTPGAAAPPVLLSALGPVMLRLAGELADGTVTVWTTPESVADHIVPTITRAASAAGRRPPRVVTSVVAAVTGEPDAVRDAVAERFAAVGELANYRAALDRQGHAGVQETVLTGDESGVARGIERYAAAGATELLVSPYGDTETRKRTLELLAELARRYDPAPGAVAARSL